MSNSSELDLNFTFFFSGHRYRPKENHNTADVTAPSNSSHFFLNCHDFESITVIGKLYGAVYNSYTPTMLEAHLTGFSGHEMLPFVLLTLPH